MNTTMYYVVNGNPISQVYGIGERGALSDYYLYPEHGKLRKQGKHLYDEHGNRMRIQGIGTHAIMQYTNLHSLEALRSLRSFGVNCVRISLYLEGYTFKKSDGKPHGSYIGNETVQDAEIQRIVSNCEQLGLYVILDWHVYSWGAGYGPGVFHQADAERFFTKYCQMYADKPFVLYELANEPHHQTIAEYLPYIKAIRTIIKTYVQDPIMITGTCQGGANGRIALWDALSAEGIDDIFISPHGYGNIRISDYSNLINYGIPVFNTEWGNSQPDGDGNREDASTRNLLNYYRDAEVPYCVWKLTDQDMTCGVLKNRGAINYAGYSDGFTDEDLSVEGLMYFTWMKYFAEYN